MASDDEHESPDPRRWDERQDSGDETTRSVVYRRNNEYLKIEALLEVIEFSGVDLLNHNSKLAFQERLSRAKQKDERRKRWAQGRMVTIWAILGTFGGAIVTFETPRIATWLTGLLP